MPHKRPIHCRNTGSSEYTLNSEKRDISFLYFTVTFFVSKTLHAVVSDITLRVDNSRVTVSS